MKMKPTRVPKLEGAISAIRLTKRLVGRIKLALGMMAVMTLMGFLTGCVGYVDGGYGGYGDYGGYDEGPGPDLYLFGGDYGRGRDVQAYSHRGSMSRSMAHAGGGGRFGGARGGGGHGGGHGGGGRR